MRKTVLHSLLALTLIVSLFPVASGGLLAFAAEPSSAGDSSNSNPSVQVLTTTPAAENSPSAGPTRGGTRATTTSTLIAGESLEGMMKSLSGSGASNQDNTTIQAIKSANESAYQAAVASGVRTENVAVDGSEPTYMWFDSATGTIYFYSPADEIQLNANSKGAFRKMRNLTNINGLADLKTDNVTDMNRMFQDTTALEDLSPLAEWNTENVINMEFMFGANYTGSSGTPMSITSLAGLSKWNVSNVTNFNQAFKGLTKVSSLDPLANWDVSSATNMNQMFNRLGAHASSPVSLDGIKGWDVTSVTNFTNMLNNISVTKPVFDKRPGTWNSAGTYTPYTKKTITLTKTWTDDSNAYNTRPANGTELGVKLGYTGSGTAPSYEDPTDVTVAKTEWVDNGDDTWTATLEIYAANDINDYTLTEGSVPTGYVAPGSASVTGSGYAGTASITNTLNTYSLTVSKAVTGNAADKTKAFDFTFSTDATASTLTYTGAQSGTITGGSGSFSLKDGESVTISGIPVGRSYNVSEADYSAAGYTTNTSGAPSGTMDADKSVTFTNYKQVSLPTGIDLGRDLALWQMMLMASLLAAVGLLGRGVMSRRREEAITSD